jgi:hypothetical protein
MSEFFSSIGAKIWSRLSPYHGKKQRRYVGGGIRTSLRSLFHAPMSALSLVFPPTR